MAKNKPKIDPESKIVADLIEEVKRRKMTRLDIGGAIRLFRNPPPTPKISHPFSGDHVRYGLVTDNHFASKWTDKRFLEQVYRRFAADKVEAIYNVGDISDGQHMHKGHEFELYAHGLDDIAQDIIDDYPSINKVPTYFIEGNHDLSFWKSEGAHIGKPIAKDRPDMIFLGSEKVDVKIGPEGRTVMRLFHPSKGTAYALSYHQQKNAENQRPEEKPNILLVGHYHKLDYLFYRNIHIFQPGTTCEQTNWMSSKDIVAMMGAMIVDFFVKKNGEVDRIKYSVIKK